MFHEWFIFCFVLFIQKIVVPHYLNYVPLQNTLSTVAIIKVILYIYFSRKPKTVWCNHNKFSNKSINQMLSIQHVKKCSLRAYSNPNYLFCDYFLKLFCSQMHQADKFSCLKWTQCVVLVDFLINSENCKRGFQRWLLWPNFQKREISERRRGSTEKVIV